MSLSAIIGTFAVSYGAKRGADFILKLSGKTLSSNLQKIKSKFAENSPAENNELKIAFRKSCLMAMQFVCERRLQISGNKPPVGFNKIQDILYDGSSTSLFSYAENEWLKKVQQYIQEQITEADKHILLTDATKEDKYQKIFQGEIIAVGEFQRAMTEDAILELKNAIEGEMPTKFAEEMRFAWFSFLSTEFQNTVFTEPKLAVKFQIDALIDIKTDTSEIKLDTAFIVQKVQEISDKQEALSSDTSSHKVVFNMPNLDERIYDRQTEVEEVLSAMCNPSEKLWLIVAPSGFGKSFLVTKVLQSVLQDGKSIKTDYQNNVQRIIRLDCRTTHTLTDIANDFNEISDQALVLDFQKEQNLQNWLNKTLFPHLQEIGTIWLIIENFESWLNQDNSLINHEIKFFLDALLEGNHSLKVLIISQTPPDSDFRKKIKELKKVGDLLFNGLPEKDALEYLRKEGADVNLDRVEDKLLKIFLHRVSFIPQALSSLIGYLKSIEEYSFEQFILDEDLWNSFDNYESENHAEDLAKRRTKALINKQIFAQTIEVQFLLGIIAFFGKPMSQASLELLFENKIEAAQTISRLISHRLAISKVDFQGTKFYELHAYILEQSREQILPRIKLWFVSKEGIKYIIELYQFGVDLLQKSSLRLSIESLESAELLLRSIKNHFKDEARIDISYVLAIVLMYKGGSLDAYKNSEDAIQAYGESINILKLLIYRNGKKQWSSDLANALLNKGAALFHLNYFAESLRVTDQAIELYQTLMQEKSNQHLAENLACALMNQGNNLAIQHKYHEAISFYNQSITIRRDLLKKNENNALEDKLAASLVNLGNVHADLDQFEEAKNVYEEGIKIRRLLVTQKNYQDGYNELATACSNYAHFIEKTNINLALKYSEEAIKYRKIVVLNMKRVQHLPELLQDYFIRIEFYIKLQFWVEIAVDVLDSGALYIDCVKESNLPHSLKIAARKVIRQVTLALQMLSTDDRAKIYAATGAYSVYVKEFVEGRTN